MVEYFLNVVFKYIFAIFLILVLALLVFWLGSEGLSATWLLVLAEYFLSLIVLSMAKIFNNLLNVKLELCWQFRDNTFYKL
jgi:hypothetical protein